MRQLGIPFEIVPGVTAGVAAVGLRGHPGDAPRPRGGRRLHHRPRGSRQSPRRAIDWAALAAFPGTLVFYMGVKNLPRISEQLIEAGRRADEPAAVIQQGTTTDQRTVTGRLVDLPELARRSGDQAAGADRDRRCRRRARADRVVRAAPAVRPSDRRDPRPRAGQHVRGATAELGAEGRAGSGDRNARAFRRGRRQAAVAEVESFELIAFTSANGVDAFFAALERAGNDARALFGASIAVVGGATADALARARDRSPTIVPERADCRGTARRARRRRARRQAGSCCRSHPTPAPCSATDCAIAAPRSTRSRSTTPSSKASRRRQIAAVAESEFVTFASGSAVHSLIQALGGPEPLHGCALVSIGPTTSDALREHGLEPTAEAEQQRHRRADRRAARSSPDAAFAAATFGAVRLRSWRCDRLHS